MKKVKNVSIVMLLLLAVTVISGCQKKPSASFSSSKTSVKVGETVTFTNTSDNGKSYKWEFGDGQTSTSSSPSHSYSSSGTYTVSMTAYSKNSKKSDRATTTITVIQTTDLAITVIIDGSSSTVDGCEVQLFTTQNDWDNYTNVVKSGYTDADGKITFTDLQPIVYYVDAYRVGYSGSGYYSNWSLGYITNALVANTVNYYNMYVEYTAKGGNKKLSIVKIEPSFPGDNNAEKIVMLKSRQNADVALKGNSLKK